VGADHPAISVLHALTGAVTIDEPMDPMHDLSQLSVEFNTNNHPLNRRKRDIKLLKCDDSAPHARVIKKNALLQLKIIF